MKSNLQHKILLALSKSKKDKGFTLIELLVVIIIIGVLSAVALPNLLGQVGRARETEARNGMGAVNRAQQSHHFEKQKFAKDVDVESSGNALGVLVESEFYSFGETEIGDEGDGEWADIETSTTDADNDNVRNYAAGIAYLEGEYDTEVCVSDETDGSATIDTSSAGDVSCDDGSSIGG